MRTVRRTTRAAVLSLALAVLCQGCGAWAQRSAVRVLSHVLDTGLTAYARETDLILAEQALAGMLKLVESLLESDPHSASLLMQAAQGFASYTYAFVEGQIEAARGQGLSQVLVHTQRAQRLYRRGMQYGLRRLGQYDAAWEGAPSLTLESLASLLQGLDQEAVPPLFWTAFCWGGLLNLERTNLETMVALPRLEALLTRLLELDETYFYGAPHLLRAVHYASRPPSLGGKPALAAQHFARAHALSQERLLLVPLLEAQYDAVQHQDRERFQRLLRQVLDAPETLFPEQAFLNAIAKRRAARLLRRMDELFV